MLKEILLASSMLTTPLEKGISLIHERPVVKFDPVGTRTKVKLDVNDGIFAYLQYLDARTTYHGIDKGSGYEANPIAASLFGKHMERRNAASITKLIYTLTHVVGVNYIRKSEQDVVTLIPLNLLYAYVIANNTYVAEEKVNPVPVAMVNF